MCTHKGSGGDGNDVGEASKARKRRPAHPHETRSSIAEGYRGNDLGSPTKRFNERSPARTGNVEGSPTKRFNELCVSLDVGGAGNARVSLWTNASRTTPPFVTRGVVGNRFGVSSGRRAVREASATTRVGKLLGFDEKPRTTKTLDGVDWATTTTALGRSFLKYEFSALRRSTADMLTRRDV